MLVLKTTSPVVSPSAPNDSPEKTVPFSSANFASIGMENRKKTDKIKAVGANQKNGKLDWLLHAPLLTPLNALPEHPIFLQI